MLQDVGSGARGDGGGGGSGIGRTNQRRKVETFNPSLIVDVVAVVNNICSVLFSSAE